mgnify:FL=1
MLAVGLCDSECFQRCHLLFPFVYYAFLFQFLQRLHQQHSMYPRSKMESTETTAKYGVTNVIAENTPPRISHF